MLPGNARLWRLLQATPRQWRLRTVGAGNVIVTQVHGIDMGLMAAMAPAYGLPADQALFDKLRIFEQACISVWAGEKTCSGQQKANCRFRFGEHLEWACDNCPDNPKMTHERK